MSCQCQCHCQIQLNSASDLPPVDCPLLIEIRPGHLVAANRTSFITNRNREMDYLLADGSTITGRYRWTYP